MDAVRAEVATALSISMRSASRLYDDAYLLCTRAPLIEALHDGRLDMSRAKLIATLLPTSDLQERFEADAIAFGAENTAHYLRKWLLSRLPDGGDENARKTAFEKRCVEVVPDRDGMSDFYGYLPTEVAEALFTALDTLARDNRTPDDDRSLDQRRADAVADLLDERTNVSTTVSVVLPASGIGASVNGSPLPWSTAWHLACQGNPTWFAWLGAPDGRVINTSPGRYRISGRVGPHRAGPRPALPLPRMQRSRRPLRFGPPGASSVRRDHRRQPALPCAGGITGSNTRPAGRWSTSATTNWNGPAPPGAATGPNLQMRSGMRHN